MSSSSSSDASRVFRLCRQIQYEISDLSSRLRDTQHQRQLRDTQHQRQLRDTQQYQQQLHDMQQQERGSGLMNEDRNGRNPCLNGDFDCLFREAVFSNTPNDSSRQRNPLPSSSLGPPQPYLSPRQNRDDSCLFDQSIVANDDDPNDDSCLFDQSIVANDDSYRSSGNNGRGVRETEFNSRQNNNTRMPYHPFPNTNNTNDDTACLFEHSVVPNTNNNRRAFQDSLHPYLSSPPNLSSSRTADIQQINTNQEDQSFSAPRNPWRRPVAPERQQNFTLISSNTNTSTVPSSRQDNLANPDRALYTNTPSRRVDTRPSSVMSSLPQVSSQNQTQRQPTSFSSSFAQRLSPTTTTLYVYHAYEFSQFLVETKSNKQSFENHVNKFLNTQAEYIYESIFNYFHPEDGERFLYNNISRKFLETPNNSTLVAVAVEFICSEEEEDVGLKNISKNSKSYADYLSHFSNENNIPFLRVSLVPNRLPYSIHPRNADDYIFKIFYDKRETDMGTLEIIFQ